MTYRYIDELSRCFNTINVSDGRDRIMMVCDAIPLTVQMCKKTSAEGGTIFFIGNGGSAAIASHMATDFCKNGGMRALAFNDPAYLTCLSNDFGYERVFSKALETHAKKGDLLFTISSSGQSANMLRAVAQAGMKHMEVITLSGFDPNNPLRQIGDVNFYVPSSEYGFVEITHLTILHMILDIANGWVPPNGNH